MKRIYWVLIFVFGLVSLLLELTTTTHEHWWDEITGFYMLFGFFGCIVLIFFSKLIGKLFIQKDEDYYNE